MCETDNMFEPFELEKLLKKPGWHGKNAQADEFTDAFLKGNYKECMKIYSDGFIKMTHNKLYNYYYCLTSYNYLKNLDLLILIRRIDMENNFFIYELIEKDLFTLACNFNLLDVAQYIKNNKINNDIEYLIDSYENTIFDYRVN